MSKPGVDPTSGISSGEGMKVPERFSSEPARRCGGKESAASSRTAFTCGQSEGTEAYQMDSSTLYVTSPPDKSLTELAAM
jgi:hypothetical protein